MKIETPNQKKKPREDEEEEEMKKKENGLINSSIHDRSQRFNLSIKRHRQTRFWLSLISPQDTMTRWLEIGLSGFACVITDVPLRKAMERMCLLIDYIASLFKGDAKEEILNDLRKLNMVLERINKSLESILLSGVKDLETQLRQRELRHKSFIADDLTDELDGIIVFSKMSEKEKFKELGKISVKISEFIEGTTRFLDQFNELGEGRKRRKVINTQEMTALDHSCIYGRDDVKQELVEVIHSNIQNQDLSIIPIIGSIGVGKTAVARNLFNDKEIGIFDMRLWVCADVEFDVRGLTSAILESVTGTMCREQSLYSLQDLLLKAVKGKRIMIVLDGVWCEELAFWNSLLNPLTNAGPGSVVFVTTQSPVVADMIGTVQAIRLHNLSKACCESIFWSRATRNKDNLNKEVRTIGDEIIKRCDGIPLIARALGDLLSFKMNKSEWQMILETPISQLPDGNAIFAAFRLSYRHLPGHLKACLTYCGIFSKGYLFEKINIIQLWMAEGLIKSSGTIGIEEVGDLLFDDLVHRFLFEPVNVNEGRKVKYKMNELVFEMAEFISGYDSFVARLNKEVTELQTQGLVRHVSILEAGIGIDCVSSFKNLRSLIVLCSWNIPSIPGSFQRNMKSIRVLDLSNSRIKEFPNSIHFMTLLRYLNLSGTSIPTISGKVSALYMLQTLNIRRCQRLKTMPKELATLLNLRHLEMDDAQYDFLLPARIGQLIMLQELRKFIVLRKDGWRIGELENMAGLREKLCIMSLENISNADEARSASLQDKEYLTRLELEWSKRPLATSLNEKDVLSNLIPHHNLKELVIRRYFSITLPDWAWAAPSKLVKVELYACNNLTCIKQLKGLHCLRNLRLIHNGVVREIDRKFFGLGGHGPDNGFYSLESIHLDSWLVLQKWVHVDPMDFPLLNEVVIENCALFHTIPDFASFGNLRKLKFTSCRGLVSSAGINRRPDTLQELIHENCATLGPDYSSSTINDEYWPFERL